MEEREWSRQVGAQSFRLNSEVYILGEAAVVGKKEGEGPLGAYFDEVDDTNLFGGENWNDAESKMMKKTAQLAMKKSGVSAEQIRYLVAGDLLGQLLATSFGAGGLPIPFLGVYGACSTMGEGLSLAAMLVDGGFADCALAVTSSHFASAEKEFRFPLGYGNQRPQAATWTVTGSGAVVLGTRNYLEQQRSAREMGSEWCEVVVSGGTIGKIVDYGVKDKANMGACMAPAAAAVVEAHFREFGVGPERYDRIVTGDLGSVGTSIFTELLQASGYAVGERHLDCGRMIYDCQGQDVHSGGSGCGCSAATLAGYLLQSLRNRTLGRILFVPTGAMLSPVSANEGKSIPGVAHAVILEGKER